MQFIGEAAYSPASRKEVLTATRLVIESVDAYGEALTVDADMVKPALGAGFLPVETMQKATVRGDK